MTNSSLGVLVQMAFKNLFAHRLKTLIIGGIILFGAALVVVGGALLDSMDQSMQRSIQGSVAGHIQVYSSKSKEELAVFGDFGGFPDLAPMDDFGKLKKTLSTVPGVKKVVPMGISGALITSGNTIDVTLGKLRNAVNKRRAGDASPEILAEIEAQKSHVKQIARVLKGDLDNLKALASDRVLDERDRESLDRAASDEFWASFDEKALDNLEFLENRVAPQTNDGDLLWVSYIGTDMDAFSDTFDRMEIVEGTAVPRGERGFLFAKFFAEEYLKVKNARRLDKINTALTVNKSTIAADPALERMVKENVSQVREIVLQLDAAKTGLAIDRLRTLLKSENSDLAALLGKFFQMDDSNFLARYDFFYKELAPLLELYRIRVGDTLTIKAFTKTGYIQSVNVKIYGTFQFKGLEKSALAGALSLIDLVSFRDLYGFLTAEKSAEVAGLKKKSGATELKREDAEAALFGGGETRVIEADATPGLINELEALEGTTRELKRDDLAKRVYAHEELETGAVLNAAVMLDDPRRIDQAMKDIEAAAKRDGLEVKVMSWQQASGLIGQFVLVLKIVLYVAVGIIFVVALVIINNSMMMATLERVREIGTLRAIGAQKRFVLAMLLVETAVLGTIFGATGAAAGAGIVSIMGRIGIPATTDELYFFFSGPRLFPFLTPSNIVGAFVIVLFVSALSSFYPAWLAMRVSPVSAMQQED